MCPNLSRVSFCFIKNEELCLQTVFLFSQYYNHLDLIAPNQISQWHINLGKESKHALAKFVSIWNKLVLMIAFVSTELEVTVGE